MGNFYTNITLRASAEEVVPILRGLHRLAYVGCRDGFAVVCDKKCDSQDLDEIASLTVTLSGRLARPALSVLNHDDDVLLFGLFADGALASEYGISHMSSVEVPKTSKREFVRQVRSAFQTTAAKREMLIPWWIRPFIAWKLVILQHEQLAAELGLPELTVGAGYRYVERGDLPRGKKTDFVQV